MAVVDVRYSPGRQSPLWGCNVDSPKAGSEKAPSRMEFAGWVLSREAPAVAVELTHDSTVFHTAQVDRPRPDVSAKYPRVSGSDRCGFRTTVDVSRLPAEFELQVAAVLGDGARIPIASLRTGYLPVGLVSERRATSYQSFPEARGSSDSETKLKRLRLPPDLTGRSVLDIGCNEGFFCQEAWRRGARRVVGIDNNPHWIERARQRDSKTDYRVTGWDSLSGLEEKFDLILLLSALHYADDPQRLLDDAMRLLSPDGVLVLECGIVDGLEAEWVRVERPVGDAVYHPTRPILSQTFNDAVVREMGPSVAQRGDPIERCVFHITAFKPIVLLISGVSRSGKTALVRKLAHGAHVSIGLDGLLTSMPTWCRDEWLMSLWHSQPFKLPERIDGLVDFLSTHDAEGRLVEEILSTHPAFADDRTPGITLIEGFALSRGSFLAWFVARLKERGYYVWHAEPAGLPATAQSQLMRGVVSPRDLRSRE